MLINSVILFLRDALPGLLFISILAAIVDNQLESIKWLPKALLAAIPGAMLVLWLMNHLSELAEGFGVELLTVLLHITIYLCVLVFIWCPAQKKVLPAAIASVLLLSTHGAYLLIYFSGFWSTPNVQDALIVGSALGLGISFSLALLLFYALRSALIESTPRLSFVILSLAGARQITEAVYFLIQADWLPASQPLWNTSKYLSDSSEFGHLLNALVGYEASPTALQVIIHIVALIIPLTLVLRNRVNCYNSKEAAR